MSMVIVFGKVQAFFIMCSYAYLDIVTFADFVGNVTKVHKPRASGPSGITCVKNIKVC